MSLVNDMLRDLETRWPQGVASVEKVAVPDRACAGVGWRMPALGLLVFCLVLAGGGLAAHLGLLGKPPPMRSVPQTQLVEAAPAEVVADTVIRIPMPSPPPAVRVTAEIRQQKNRLLEAAATAFRLDHLTTPDYDNAYDRYRAVLSLDPDDEAAQAGIAKIRQRYLDVLQQALIEGRRQQVPALIRRAQLVGVPRSEIDARIEMVGEPVQTEVAAPETSAANSSGISLATAAATVADRDRDAAGTVVESLESRERKILKRSQQLLASGEMATAEQILSRFVAAEADATSAAQLLFDLYLTQGKTEPGRNLIKRTSGLTPLQKAYMQAQLAVRAEDYSSAARLLQSESASPAEDQNYIALLAAVQHKLGAYEQAAALYRQLTGAAPQQVNYWLGLAVCLDKFDAAAALSAYRRVQHLSGGGETFSAYVDERVRLLAQR